MENKFTTYFEVESKYIHIRITPNDLKLKLVKYCLNYRNNEEAIIEFNKMKDKIQSFNYTIKSSDPSEFRVFHTTRLIMGVKLPKKIPVVKPITAVKAKSMKERAKSKTAKV